MDFKIVRFVCFFLMVMVSLADGAAKCRRGIEIDICKKKDEYIKIKERLLCFRMFLG